MFVTSQGSALTRFHRALEMGNGPAAYAAATELPRVDLADALRLTLLLVHQRQRFERLCVRWVGRFAAETREVELAHAQLALAALAAVRPGDTTGAQALGGLCAGRGRDDLAQVVDEWLGRQPA
jgi:hypothetical protein